MSETVWLIENGYYEDRIVVAVAATIDAAVAHIKSRYGEPYRVEWEPLEIESQVHVLRGYFEGVAGYSTKHVGEFSIYEETVHDFGPRDCGV